MLHRLLTYIKEGSVYTGLEVYELQGRYGYHLLELQKKANELHITKEKKLNEPTEITQHLSKNTPLFLTINTTNVLTKKMDNIVGVDSETLVDAAFPNLNLENFYYEVIRNSKDPIVTISKKEYIDKILEKLQTLKIDVLHFSLGISGLENIMNYWEQPSMTVSNFQLEIRENKIQEIYSLEKDRVAHYTVNGLHLTNNNLLSFSSVIGYLGAHKADSNFNSINEISKKEFTDKRIFSFGLKSALGFFLSLLLLNFFVFDHYFDKVETLKATMELNNSKINALKELDISVAKKQERVTILSSSTNSKATYYLDQFAKMVPSTILLDKITYQPLEKPMRESKPISLEENQILVSGTSKSGDLFSQWIVELEKQNWISSVETMDYAYVSSTTSNFVIKIAFSER